MGYRSDIGLALTQSAVQRMHQKLNSLDKNSEAISVIKDFIIYSDKHHDDDDSAADVSFIENLLAELDWKDFLFIRIVEDYDDTEVRGYFWDNPFEIKLIREIKLSDIVHELCTMTSDESCTGQVLKIQQRECT